MAESIKGTEERQCRRWRLRSSSRGKYQKGHEIQASMMQFDVAATVAAIFKLKQPQVWIGRPIMEVFK